jgi:hypothetical protein
MTRTPFRPEDITNEWLSEAVGDEVTGFDMEQIGIGVGLLGRLYRIDLKGAGPGSVIAKFPTLDEGARMNVIEPMNFYEKEIRFYEQIAADTPIGTPRVYFSDFDRESRDFVLLLEDLSDRRMEDQVVGCRSDDALITLGPLAEHHAKWWESDKLDALTWLPRIADPPYPQVIAGMFKQSWPRAQEVLGDHLSARYREYGDRYVELVQWFCDEGSKPPVTFVHGDFRLDNLFFGNGDRSLVVVDWQLSFRGRAGYDLAYFTSQSLTSAERTTCEDTLKRTYLEALGSHGIDYPEDEFSRDYRRTVAFCFVYPVVAAGQIEPTNERHVALIVEMIDRSVQAIEDNDALAVLPS